MIPDIVKFYGDFEINPQSLFRYRKNVPIPYDWERISFHIDDLDGMNWLLPKWIETNMMGNFIINTNQVNFYKKYSVLIIIGFEQINDAIMFKLMDGHNAWI